MSRRRQQIFLDDSLGKRPVCGRDPPPGTGTSASSTAALARYATCHRERSSASATSTATGPAQASALIERALYGQPVQQSEDQEDASEIAGLSYTKVLSGDLLRQR